VPDNEADVDMRMDVDTPNVSSLEIRASRLARSHVTPRRPGIRPSPIDRLEAQETLLREACKTLRAAL
jgi:hypothetical protein